MDSLILGLRVVVALGAVLGLMWYLQRRLGKGTGRRRADRALTVVSRQSLGQKASVVVVDAAGQRFLLGVTEHAVNVLHTGDIPEEPEEEAPVPGTSRGFGEFARILSEANPLSGRQGGAPTDGQAYDGTPSEGQASDGGASDDGDSSRNIPVSRRASIHRNAHTRGLAGRGTGHPPLHGSILAGSTWKQAAAALRTGRRN